MVKRQRQRSKNLGDSEIEAIVGILDGWTEKLTWELLIDATETRTRMRYTRQALNQHVRIKLAFQLTKARLSGVSRPQKPLNSGLNATDAKAFMDRFHKLEAENTRLKLENERLLEQFVIWAYNASNRGLDADYLSQPLPRVDRDQTQLKREIRNKSQG
ncbi:hypothetical protein EGI20_07665 [Aquitalea sp. S1-19]|nr:hypothetical protein [Aquitalea sp. S1-19]